MNPRVLALWHCSLVLPMGLLRFLRYSDLFWAAFGLLVLWVVAVWTVAGVMCGGPLIRLGGTIERMRRLHVWAATPRRPAKDETFWTLLVLFLFLPAAAVVFSVVQLVIIVVWLMWSWWPTAVVGFVAVDWCLLILALWVRGLLGRDAAGARARYRAALAAIDRADMDEQEKKRGRDRAKQLYMGELEAIQR